MSVRVFDNVLFVASAVAFFSFATITFTRNHPVVWSDDGDARAVPLITENGWYYSFYLDVVKEPNVGNVLPMLMNHNRTEFRPVNVFKRFNCIQEVLVGLAYRLVRAFLPWNPLVFYAGVCFANFGLGMGAFQRIPAVLVAASDRQGLAGLRRYKSALLAVSFYVGNLFYASRVWSYPPLRENWGIPVLFWQLYFLLQMILSVERGNVDRSAWRFVIATWVCLAVWQFTQYVFLVQTVGVLFMHCVATALGTGKAWDDMVATAMRGYLVAVGLATVTAGFDKTLVGSPFFALVLCSVATLRVAATAAAGRFRGAVVLAVAGGALVAWVVAKGLLFRDGADDHSHVLQVLLYRLGGGESNFHVNFYANQPEFMPLPGHIWSQLVTSALVPCALAVTIALPLLSFQWGAGPALSPREVRAKAGLVLLAFQTLGCVCMATLMMRFVGLAVPHMCLLASLVTSLEPYWVGRGSGRGAPRYRVLLQTSLSAITMGMAWYLCAHVSSTMVPVPKQTLLGVDSSANVRANVMLLRWIKKHTIAGSRVLASMPDSSIIKAGGHASILVHPQYENVGLRSAVLNMSVIYSSRTPRAVHNVLVSSALKPDFVVLNANSCQGRVGTGTPYTEMLDKGLEQYEVANGGNLFGATNEKGSFCSRVFSRKKPERLPKDVRKYFSLVYMGETFAVLKVGKAKKRKKDRGGRRLSFLDDFSDGNDASRQLCNYGKLLEFNDRRQQEAYNFYEESLAYGEAGKNECSCRLAIISEQVLRDHAKALRYYEQADVFFSEHMPAADVLLHDVGTCYSNYAMFLDEALGETTKAEKYYLKAIHFDPFESSHYANYGFSLYVLGKTGEAELQYKRALGLAPEDGPVNCMYGAFLNGVGRKQLAIQHYNVAKRVSPGIQCVKDLATVL